MQANELQLIIEKFPSILCHFKGIFSIDNVPKRIRKNCFLIINNQTSTEPGQHWFCLIKKSSQNYEYFDSLGVNETRLDLLKYFKILPFYSIVKFNETCLQNSTSSTCGLFVLYFLIHRLHNFDMSFSEIMNEIFTVNTEQNEILVENFAKDVLDYTI